MLKNDYEEELIKGKDTSKKNVIINIPHKKIIISKTKITRIKTIVIIYSIIFFMINYMHLFLKNEIILDNKMKPEYENDTSFSEYSTKIKSIALYNPKDYSINNTLVNKEGKLIAYDINAKKLQKQAKLAKNHGIYGFGFYYFWPYDNAAFNSPLDVIIENNDIDINFLLIWEPALIDKKHKKDNKVNTFNATKFFDDIKKYVIDNRYIRFKNKRPIIGINNKDIEKKDINILRQKFRENYIGEIFILLNVNDTYINNDYNISYRLNTNIFDGLYYTTQTDFLEKVELDYNKLSSYYYTELLYHNLLMNITENYLYIFRTSIPLLNFPKYIKENKAFIYEDYTKEKFYFLNRLIIQWTQKNYAEDSQYIFIGNFSFLEKDSELGYSNINTFSKALYNIPLIDEKKFNLVNLEKDSFILVQAHVYYTELLFEVINKTNNIPVPFDLFITTDTKDKKYYIEDYLKRNTKAKKYEVLITENKGRDVIPFLKQTKDIWDNYKYFCHIHTKKHGYNDLGNYWQNYLYNNLLGNKNIVSQILTDFENNNKLGIILPEHFYTQIKFVKNLHHTNRKYLYDLFKTLIPFMRLKIGQITDFPAGNMFWARTSAVHQIFNEKVIEKTPEERGQIDGTVIHAIERIWPYLAKLNGFCYKCALYFI